MEAVVFDIDGTLVQSVAADDRLYRHAVTSVLGPVRFRSEWSDYACVTDSGILSQLLEDNDLSDVSDPTAVVQTRFVDALRGHIADHGPFVEVPGANKFVSALRRSANHRVAIATGGWRASAELKLTSAGVDTTGIPVATSDAEPERTEIMLSALSSLGDSFDRITYYGDGVWDREACAKLGWRFEPVGETLDGLRAFPEYL